MPSFGKPYPSLRPKNGCYGAFSGKKSVHPTSNATNALLHMPDRFTEWLTQHEAGEQPSWREAAE